MEVVSDVTGAASHLVVVTIMVELSSLATVARYPLIFEAESWAPLLCLRFGAGSSLNTSDLSCFGPA